MKKYLYLLLLFVISDSIPLSLSAQNGVHNGHRYVDLGLPSGTKWADCNIGAIKETNKGDYFAWGETTTKGCRGYYWYSYKYGKEDDKLTKYCTKYSYGLNGFTDNKTELDLSDDVAHTLWGGEWRMPTDEQFEELFKYTTRKRIYITNYDEGILFTGKNGNSIFLPAGGHNDGIPRFSGVRGYYWSRTLNGYPNEAVGMYFISTEVGIDVEERSHGRKVRPVYVKRQPVESASVLKVSGTDNGHGYVDLGLPSGTKWADCNVGASSPTQYGNYYAWGETTTKSKSDYGWDTYKYGRDYNKFTKYCTNSKEGKNGFKDNKTILDLADDVAHKVWGGQWRIPTKKQFEELIKYTKHKWTSINGVDGTLFTGRNGRSIFLPAAGNRDNTLQGYGAGFIGYYWSRTLYSGNSGCSYYLHFYSTKSVVAFNGRNVGLCVRPVFSSEQREHPSISVSIKRHHRIVGKKKSHIKRRR